MITAEEIELIEKGDPLSKHRDQVKKMAMLGLPQKQMAGSLRISTDTLRRVFEDELLDGCVDANEKAMETLYSLVTMDRNVAATIFWARTRCGYRTELGHVDMNAILEGRDSDPMVGPAVEAATEVGAKTDVVENAPRIVIQENGDEPPERW